MRFRGYAAGEPGARVAGAAGEEAGVDLREYYRRVGKRALIKHRPSATWTATISIRLTTRVVLISLVTDRRADGAALSFQPCASD
jgi:hypothetical protein